MKRIYPTALLLLIVYTSCTVYKEYQIEIYKPGEVFVPDHIANAAIIYRNFKYTGDTLQNFFKDGYQLKKVQNPENFDSLLVSLCVNELALNFKRNKLFSNVLVFPYPTFDRHTGNHLPELPPDLVSRLTTEANAGLLIALETFSSFFSTYPASADVPLTNEVVTVAVWAIYDPAKGSMVERKTMIDTLFWNGYDADGNLQQNYVPPPRIEALKMASAYTGETYARRFVAGWQTETRMYSVPPLPDFSEAAYYLGEGKWDDAIRIWKRYAGNSSGKMAIDARYNLALAYEMKDDLKTALEWLEAAHVLAQSYRSKNNLEMIQLYQKALKTRQRDAYKLNLINNENHP